MIAFFIALAWKSAVIAGVALALATPLRLRAAADRAALLRAAVILLLLLPPLSLLLPALEIELGSAGELVPLLAPEDAFVASAAPAPAVDSAFDPVQLMLPLYLAGLLLILARLGTGIGTLRRWTARAYPALNPFWTEPFDRLRRRGAGDAKLLVSGDVGSPLSWGWRRPVILIDHESHRRSDDAEAVLAHEMAHVARGDWRTLLLARAAVALFWFNPLVWAIERRLLEDAEEAADRDAIGGVEPVRYAQTLLDYAQAASREPVPAHGIATTPLARRVRAVLHGEVSAPSGSTWSKVAIGASLLLAGPVAALELVAAPLPAPAIPAPPLAALAIPEPPAVPTAPAVAIAVRAADGTATVAPARPRPPQPPVPSRALQTSLPRQAAQAPLPPHARQAPLPPRLQQSRLPPSAPLPPMPSHHAQLVKVVFAEPGSVAFAFRRADAEAARAAAIAESQGRDAVRQAQRSIAAAHAAAARNFRLSMEQAARGMEKGAIGMEQGAQRMEEEARELRSRAYREQKIAEAAARGRTLTHEELEETAEGLAEGAEEMREGAQEMRQGAEEMRREQFEA